MSAVLRHVHLRVVGKHEGRWRHCSDCGHPENEHPYRHPFRMHWRLHGSAGGKHRADT